MDRQQRRQVALETMSLAVAVPAAVGFSGAFVAHWPGTVSAGAALATAVLVAVGWTGWRGYRPPVPQPWGESDVRDVRDPDTAPADEGWWDRTTGTLLVVAFLAGGLVLAIAVRFLPALVVVAAFALVDSASALGDVVLAVMCTVAVGILVEKGVVEPLSRRWDVDVDGVPGLPAR